jgi:hypothetical protein
VHQLVDAQRQTQGVPLAVRADVEAWAWVRLMAGVMPTPCPYRFAKFTVSSNGLAKPCHSPAGMWPVPRKWIPLPRMTIMACSAATCL